MAILLDLDDDVDSHVDHKYDSGYESTRDRNQSDNSTKPIWILEREPANPISEENRPNPNINGFSAALGCYPIVAQLACQLDLNTIDNLAMTCRQFRANLLEYRPQIMGNTLRCGREDLEMGGQLAERLREMQVDWMRGGEGGFGSRITSGKVGKCARDMVGACRRCSKIICRNCIAKPPAPQHLKARHRRLCRTCIATPLTYHLQPPPTQPETAIPYSSSPPPRRSSSHSLALTKTRSTDAPPPNPQAFTAQAFSRSPCTCPTNLWICTACSITMRPLDMEYTRAWAWRTRQCSVLGGLGTGIGLGVEGVKCGRGSACLNAQIIEQEVACELDELLAFETEAQKVEKDGTGRSWKGTSFLVQEVEGIGGVVKKKVKRLVGVGDCVEEMLGERERERDREYLGLSPRGALLEEIEGRCRSWCAWCERVVPSHQDLECEEPPDGGR